MNIWSLLVLIGYRSREVLISDKGFRQETGYYTESKEVIKQMKANLSNRMNTKI